MADNLDFNVQLRLLNEQFNNGVNQARDKFGELRQSIERNVSQMNTDTERAATLIGNLANVSPDRLTAELGNVSDQLRQMGAGANLTRDQLDSAMSTAALQVTRLARELEVAKSEVTRLGNTPATPAQLEQAAAKVGNLTGSVEAARLKVEQLSRTNGTPEQIEQAKVKVDNLTLSLNEARQKTEQLSQTNGTPAQILEARAKVAGLKGELDAAKLAVKALNDANATPAEIEAAKAKVNDLKLSIAAARDETKRLSETSGSPADILEAKARAAALKAELEAAQGSARLLSQTSGSPADIAAAVADVARLDTELNEARLAAERLNSTGASPSELAEAAERVNRLEQELGQASTASERLSNELAGAMNRASNTADNARNAIYRMANVRVPETIRAEIDEISRSLVNFQNNSGRPAAEIDRVTRAAEERIRQLRNELNGLDDTQDRVSQGSSGLGGNINRLQGAFGSLQGLLAAAGLGIGVAEIIETADAFKNLEARVKLATGEGAQFITAFEGVKQIANATFSSVESTGELFTRIAKSSEALGLAQSEVLSITETINQAMKLSGGSAASVDAAITQLIQGLQSGVVRGEEFNSIMEQAPRLAQAMADGLGVTRGELRGMAQDGKLTSEVVINAVRDQGAAISSEFATLPTTVSNALQVAKNQIFNFVGEIDSSLNQTSKLAEAISYIGDSLEDLDPGTVSALTGAFKNTIEAVVELAKLIKQAYDNATAQINFLAGASEDASEKVGLITAALHGVNVFTGAVADGIKGLAIAGNIVSAVLAEWAALATRFYASLTFGEGKKAILDLAETLDKAASAAWKRANDGAMEFESSTAKALGNAGKTAKDRFAEMAVDAQAAYDKMVESGNASAEALEEQFVKVAQAKIQANDGVVTDSLRLELAEKNLQAVIDDTGKVSIESAKAIQASYLGVGESFAEVALKAQESGKSIELSLSEAIHKANTRGAVNDIISSLQAMANQGVITGEQLALGQNIANTQMSIVEAQIAKNMETFGEYAAGVLAKNGNIITAELQHAASLENLAIQMDETGSVMITELDASTVASGRTKDQIDELAQSVGQGLSKEFIKSRDSLDAVVSGFKDLQDAGYNAGHAVVSALTNMTDKASNTDEINYVIEQWKQLGSEGKITGKELADGLDLANERLDALTDGVNSVAEAYGVLGLKTRQEAALQAQAYTQAYGIILKDGQATTGQLKEAFEKTAKAAIAANGDVVTATLQNQAAQRGLRIEVDETGRVTFKSLTDAAEATRNAKPPVDNLAQAHSNLSSAAGNAGDSMVKAAQKANEEYSKLRKTVDEMGRMLNTEGEVVRAVYYTRESAYKKIIKDAGINESELTFNELQRLEGKASQVANASGHRRDPYKYGLTNGIEGGKMIDDFVSAYKQEELQKLAKKNSVNNSIQQTPDKSPVPNSALQAQGGIMNNNSYGNFANSNTASKTIDVNFKLGGTTARLSMPQTQESALQALLKELEASKAIAGY